VIPEGAKDEARPAPEAGRASLRLLIRDKDGNERIVDCEANIAPPVVLVNQPETQGSN